VPRKAAYLAFETSNGLEFEFFLAQKLGMTVAALRAEMTNDEFLHWSVYYARKAQREELEMLKSRGR
jgi:predicted membrane-bound spermidine synthase